MKRNGISFKRLKFLLVALATEIILAITSDAIAADTGKIVVMPSEAIKGVLTGRQSPSFQASQAIDFTVAPSVTTSSVGAGIKTMDLTFVCVNGFGFVVPFCDINLLLTAVSFNSGHSHDSSTPTGFLNPSSGNSGLFGFSTTYTAPEASGLKVIDGFGTAEGQSFFGHFNLGVEVAGLVNLPPGINYELVGGTSAHPSNHFGTATFNSSLSVLADKFGEAFPGETLRFNDMSLIAGGIFDLDENWLPPHATHRFGTDLDLGLVPPKMRDRLRKLILGAGISKIIAEGTHWHLRQ